jgi:hypothetical protein
MSTTQVQPARHQYTWGGHSIAFEAKPDALLVNATQMGKAFSKEPRDFLRTSQTKAFIDVLAHSANLRSDDVVVTVNGGTERGTWMHRRLALKFAAWLSPEFELWVYDRIEELLLGFSSVEQEVQPLPPGQRSYPSRPLPQPPATDVLDARHVPYGFVSVLGKTVRHIVLQDRDWYSISDLNRALGCATDAPQSARKLNASRAMAQKIWLFGATNPSWFTTSTGMQLLMAGSHKLYGAEVAAMQEGGPHA